MASTARSPPPSPAARRVTSPPPQSPPAAPAKASAPPSPERHKSVPPASSPNKPAAPSSPPKPPSKKDDSKKDAEPDEKIPDPEEELDIDETVFGQITEMDDEDPECEFSREIVVDYFKQAATTFGELRDALEKKNLAVLSAKGHFLKGSSAALGVKKVQESCEHIQHYGAKRDEIKGVDLTEAQALRRIALIMPRLEHDYELAEKWLRDYYHGVGVELDE
ncbi:multistep phosphorelay regulator 1 [Ceratobasidium sp. AG-Ba]|nr:multistep phosphorelay regulator 1 [Ceratobasidium sp. AG-Ba]QRW06539.1 multistep phosphorelay regulator 1 [Ceratobasidium sp. AG-Ba]